MKRLTAGILTAALILALAGTTALASGRCHGRQELCYPSCAICGGTALHCQDADGDGVCDGFTDEDGDGVCDHHAEVPGIPSFDMRRQASGAPLSLRR